MIEKILTDESFCVGIEYFVNESYLSGITIR